MGKKTEKSSRLEVELDSCLKIFEVMGLQYFTLKNLKLENPHQRPTVLRTFYLIFVAIIGFTSLVLGVFDNTTVNKKITSSNVIIFGVKRFLNVAIASVMCFGTILSFLSTRENEEIFKNFKKISGIVNNLDMEMDFKVFKKSSWRVLILILSVFTVVHGLLGYYVRHEENVFLLMTLLGVSIMFLLMILHKTVFYVSLVNFSLEVLNKIIANIFQNIPVNIEENISYHFKSVKPKEDPLEELKKTREIFNLVYKSGKIINKCNGFTLFALMSSLVTSLTLSGYELFIFSTVGSEAINVPSK